MNLITNNCLGAMMFTTSIKEEFPNPFMWSSINIDNFCKLIKNYDILNFENIKCELVINDSKTICEQGSTIAKILIDNIIEVYYFHYQYNPKYTTEPKKIGGYRYFNHIDKYTYDEYFKRLNRMNEPPIFLWHLTEHNWYNPNKIDIIKTLCELDTEYNIIIYGKNIKNDKIDNIILLEDVLKSRHLYVSGDYIYQKLLKEFKYEI